MNLVEIDIWLVAILDDCFVSKINGHVVVAVDLITDIVFFGLAHSFDHVACVFGVEAEWGVIVKLGGVRIDFVERIL